MPKKDKKRSAKEVFKRRSIFIAISWFKTDNLHSKPVILSIIASNLMLTN
jgi:preprotein translocase subunit Sec63